MIGLKFRSTLHTKGLADAPNILSRNMRGGLEALGKLFRRSAQKRMRKDTGAERRSLIIKVEGRGLDLKMSVFSTLVQAFADAFGIKKGTIFPPYGPGTKLHGWAARKMKVASVPSGGRHGVRRISHLSRRPRSSRAASRPTRQTGVKRVGNVRLTDEQRRTSRAASIRRFAFLVARSVFERGIKPTHWNTKALEANKSQIRAQLQNAITRSVTEINRG